MNRKKYSIDVTEYEGIYRVPADIGKGFHLFPTQDGTMKLAFWDKERLKDFLDNFGFYAVINHSRN